MSPFHGSHNQSARRTVANGKHRKRMQMQAVLIPEKLTSSGLNMLDRTLRELRAATLSHYTFSGRDAGGLWRCSWCRVSLRSFGRKIFNALSLQPFLLDRNTFIVQWWYTDDKINNYKIVSWYSKRLTIAWCYVDAGNLERLRIGQNRLCFGMDPSVIHRYWDQMNQISMMFTSGVLMFHVSNQRPQVDLGLFQRVDEETHELGLFPHNACGLGRHGWQRENFFDKTSCLSTCLQAWGDTLWHSLIHATIWTCLNVDSVGLLTCFGDGIMAVSPCHNILRSSYLWWFEHLNPSIARERRWSKCGAHSAATGLGQHGEGGMWWTRPCEDKMRNENNIFNRSDHASSSSLTRGGQGKDRKRTRREVNTMQTRILEHVKCSR